MPLKAFGRLSHQPVFRGRLRGKKNARTGPVRKVYEKKDCLSRTKSKKSPFLAGCRKIPQAGSPRPRVHSRGRCEDQRERPETCPSGKIWSKRISDGFIRKQRISTDGRLTKSGSVYSDRFRRHGDKSRAGLRFGCSFVIDGSLGCCGIDRLDP